MIASYGLVTLFSISAWQLAVADTIQDAILQFPDMFRQFEDFMMEHKKTYETEEEKLHRFNIFKRNLQDIEVMNAESDGTVEYGVNKFTDWTHDEFRAILTFNASAYHGMLQDAIPEEPVSEDDLNEGLVSTNKPDPVAFDWRVKSKFYPPVLDQGDCGSCYAFTTAGVISILHSYQKKTILEYSPQQLVDCSKNEGCNGGMFEESFDWTKNPGLALDKDYPYKCKQYPCNTKVKPAVKVKCYIKLPVNDENTKKELPKCPLAIGMDASAMEFKAYKSGVLKPASCDPKNLNHAVALVGYTIKEGKTIWHVRNSWAKSWGERGHFRMEANYCGIGTEVFKFVIADKV